MIKILGIFDLRVRMALLQIAKVQYQIHRFEADNRQTIGFSGGNHSRVLGLNRDSGINREDCYSKTSRNCYYVPQSDHYFHFDACFNRQITMN